ncbi:MAG TPA: GNAT family N-acetyltransferase [Anaerolineales bacterium]|nr:GNAT family N-acetyltransferase [Anaerolineales bacterium]
MFTQQKTILRDLGSGLIMRRSSPADADALAEFNGRIHGSDPQDTQRIATFTHDLLSRPHPTLNPDDFTIVEDPATGRIVSSMNLIPQTWAYEGIEFGVGRPELVGTEPEFRKRGLVRAQFEEVHKWSAERGHRVQAITGIPYYYRQFGYEMTLDLAGRRFGFEAHVPKWKDGEEEPYRIRVATQADLTFIAEVYEHAIRRHMITCVRTPEIFKYELDGQSENNADYFQMYIIENLQGERLGYFQHPNCLGRMGVSAIWYELKPGVSWLAITPSVVRHLWNKGQEYGQRDAKACTSFGLLLGAQHPAYEALGKDLPSVHNPYAWYLRVPDLTGFLNHIKPALEKRIADSIGAGHSREIKISFYRNGLRLVLEKGKLIAMEDWKPSPEDEGVIAFPDRTFLQILFGYRSYDELCESFADCWCDSEEVRSLINILFPKKLSDVFPVA